MADPEQVKQLKFKRQQAKSMVTRQSNTVEKNMVIDKKDKVRETLDLLTTALEKFEEASSTYESILDDEESLIENEKYSETVYNKYIETVNKAKAWLNSDGKVDSKSEEIKSVSQSNKELISAITLPKVEIVEFGGDPLKYHIFMAVFDETVHRTNESDQTKLTRLLRYTIDSAYNAISKCVLMEPSEGYAQARKILAERFGNHHTITERIVQGLIEGKPIRSAEALQEFSDDLSNGYATLKQMNSLVEVQSQSYIVKIVDRLQLHLKNRWKRKAMELKEESDRYPNFEELVNFVNKEAREASDPVYGKLNSKPCNNATNIAKKSSAFTSRTDDSSRVYTCVLCKGGHRLFYCKEFREMRPRQRLEFVTKNKLCENCLLGNHQTSQCRKKSVCSVPGCGKRHTKYIHVNEHSNANDSGTNVRLVNANASVSSNVHMPIVPVRVNDVHEVCALLDSASSNTFCSQELLDMLGVESNPVTYSLSTLSSDEDVQSRSVNLRLSSLDAKESLSMSNVYVVNKIPVLTSCPEVKAFPHFKGLQFVAGGQPVHLLIGQDNAEALVPLEVKRGKKGEPFACKTLFGWSVNGPDTLGPTSKKVISHFIKSDPAVDVDRLWDIEHEGLESVDSGFSQNDKRVVDLWNQEIKLIDGHYQIPIPWKDGVVVPNNFMTAKSRLVSLQRSLDKRGLMERYEGEIVKLLDSGYAEPVPIYDMNKSDKVWYLPHHAVINPKKPEKLRIVFDCASRFRGESLNDKCYRGPDLNNKLLHVLLRFRQHEFSVMADIEAMYYQVRIPLEDRDVLRFLWVDSQGDIAQYRMTSHVFGGIWCASSSTFALRQTLLDDPGISELVRDTVSRSFYVDDWKLLCGRLSQVCRVSRRGSRSCIWNERTVVQRWFSSH